MPLTVESFSVEGSHPLKAEATRVVVRDSAGNPVFLAVEHAPGAVFCARLGDDDFDDLLAVFGLAAPKVRRQIDL